MEQTLPSPHYGAVPRTRFCIFIAPLRELCVCASAACCMVFKNDREGPFFTFCIGFFALVFFMCSKRHRRSARSFRTTACPLSSCAYTVRLRLEDNNQCNSNKRATNKKIRPGEPKNNQSEYQRADLNFWENLSLDSWELERRKERM